MRRLAAKIAAGAVIAVVSGFLGWSCLWYYVLAADLRHEPELAWIGLFPLLLFTCAGLGAIAALFAPSEGV